MGSDCAYFSGPEDASDDEEGFEDQTFNFDLEDQPRPKKHQTAQKVKQDALSSDGEFADFQHQVIDDNDQIVEDFEYGYEDGPQDSYLQSQFDFMYSEDTETEGEEELRKSMKEREKEFYGEDVEDQSTEQTLDTDGPEEERKEISSKQRALIEKKINEKKRRLQELGAKLGRNREQGNLAAGSEAKFQECLDFFKQKVDSCEELGDQEAEEVQRFV